MLKLRFAAVVAMAMAVSACGKTGGQAPANKDGVGVGQAKNTLEIESRPPSASVGESKQVQVAQPTTRQTFEDTLNNKMQRAPTQVNGLQSSGSK